MNLYCRASVGRQVYEQTVGPGAVWQGVGIEYTAVYEVDREIDRVEVIENFRVGTKGECGDLGA